MVGEKKYKARHDEDGICQYYLDSIRKQLDLYDGKKYQITHTEAAKRLRAVIRLTDAGRIEEKQQPYLK